MSGGQKKARTRAQMGVVLSISPHHFCVSRDCGCGGDEEPESPPSPFLQPPGKNWAEAPERGASALHGDPNNWGGDRRSKARTTLSQFELVVKQPTFMNTTCQVLGQALAID